jgi:tetraacyldisaccharide 4'-kinase
VNEDLQLLRKGLWPLSVVYGIAITLRNYLFHAGIRKVHRVGVPVVSVGNIAAGGTGKTPLVVWLVERAIRAGKRPGVLARGYGRAPGEELNDEGKLLARRFPGLAQVQDPDRVRGARRLIAENGVDVIIVDDGFQHRRLHRDWDLVCLDTVRPFAGGLLPVGYLREYPKALRRADALILTRAGGIAIEAVEERREKLAACAGADVPAFASDHVPVRLREMPSGAEIPLEALRGKRVVLLSGIARPESFAETVEGLGAEVVHHVRRRDHHLHTSEELSEIEGLVDRLDATLVTTEKDDVKLVDCSASRLVLELDLRFLGEEPEPSTFLSFRETKHP